MIEFQQNRVSLSTIHARMCHEIVEHAAPVFSAGTNFVRLNVGPMPLSVGRVPLRLNGFLAGTTLAAKSVFLALVAMKLAQVFGFTASIAYLHAKKVSAHADRTGPNGATVR